MIEKADNLEIALDGIRKALTYEITDTYSILISEINTSLNKIL